MPSWIRSLQPCPWRRCSGADDAVLFRCAGPAIPIRCRDIQLIAVLCDHHDRDDVPEAAYCPACDQLCRLTLAAVKADRQTAVTRR
ncbi:hypothetical protein ACFQY4_18205 [Catellatospora bangladeshensis]|uniref:Uncharacterized protein n=1 Tax=Catellatospora bangladeshensis TaxID=310355 RepID=A0A8J3JJY4_9ACTN|nr:hypothetical protein Cba03nite_34000 [Catellatospora bangladeshensis]